jgi:uncharacterized Tic20 family protein
MDETTPPPMPEKPATTPPNSDEKLWILFAHLSFLVGLGLIVPLVIYLVKKPESTLIGDHAREALNFHISVYVYMLAMCITCFLAWLAPVVWVAGAIAAIVAAIKASDGQFFRYPLTFRLVK